MFVVIITILTDTIVVRDKEAYCDIIDYPFKTSASGRRGSGNIGVMMHEPAPTKAACPECHQLINFPYEPALNHLLLCPHCETILMVAVVVPLQLDWAFEEPISAEEASFFIISDKAYWQFPNSYP